MYRGSDREQKSKNKSKSKFENKKVKDFVKASVTAMLAMGLTTQTSLVQAEDKVEKCYGIVKKAMNDCGANNHSCQGQSPQDNDPNEWIFLPVGSCKKIVGGSLEPIKVEKKDKTNTTDKK